MPPRSLTPVQQQNAMKGLERMRAVLGGSEPASQEQLAFKLGVTQQYVSGMFASGEVSRNVAEDVARFLGVEFKDLIDHGRVEPPTSSVERKAVRIGDLAGYGQTLGSCRLDRDIWESVPEWCWDQTADWMTPDPPSQLTKLYLWNLAKAAFDGATADKRREMEGRAASKRLDTASNFGSAREVQDLFAPPPPSDTRLPTRRGGK